MPLQPFRSIPLTLCLALQSARRQPGAGELAGLSGGGAQLLAWSAGTWSWRLAASWCRQRIERWRDRAGRIARPQGPARAGHNARRSGTAGEWASAVSRGRTHPHDRRYRLARCRLLPPALLVADRVAQDAVRPAQRDRADAARPPPVGDGCAGCPRSQPQPVTAMVHHGGLRHRRQGHAPDRAARRSRAATRN